VLDLALRVLVRELEKRKFAATTRPRREGAPAPTRATSPAHVKRAAWSAIKASAPS